MNINGINTYDAANSTATAKAVNDARTNVGADEETFLKLLVAQLKNQDPLNPQDGTAFVAQLAQFSSLEQLTGIHQKLGQLVDLSQK